MNPIAIATNTNGLSGQLAYSPGHCKYFCIVEAGIDPIFIENPAFQAKNAFGQLAFKKLCELNVKIVIANFFGPRFTQLAKSASIRLLSPPRDINTLESIIHFLNLNIMPNLNHNGPTGEGPRTGNKQGKCNPENKGLSDEAIIKKRESSKTIGQGQGDGLGKGRGRSIGQGKGRGNRKS